MSHPDRSPGLGRVSETGGSVDHTAVRRRDQSLRRVGNTTRWVAAAAAAGSVVLGAGYAQALPGKSSASTGSTAAASTPVPSQRPSTPRSVSPTAHPAPTRTPPLTPERTVPPSAARPQAHPAAQAPASTPTPAPPAPAPQPSHTTSGAS